MKDKIKASNRIGNRKVFAEFFVDLFTASEANEGKLPSKIMVVPVGEWNTGEYGRVKITEKQIGEMVSNFNDNIRVGVPIDVDHDAKGAAGWVKKLIDRGKDGLWASVEWTAYGTQLLKDRIYRFFSPEFSLEYIDPETSEHFGPVFVAGTLTNRPLFKELNPLVASDKTGGLTSGLVGVIIKGNEMELVDILAKKPADRTPEEVEFLGSATLSAEQKTQLEAEIAAAEKIASEEARVKADEEAKAKEAAKAEAKVKASEIKEEPKSKEKLVTIKATELEAIKKMAEEGVKANRELLKMSVIGEVEKNYIFSEKGGKVAPKGKDALVSLIMSFSEEQSKLFDEVMLAVPERKLFSELGGSGESDATEASARVMGEAKKIMASEENKGLTFRQALDIIKKDKPELYKEYILERNK